MSKTNYQSLKELTKELSSKLQKLSDGKLKIDDIERITDQAKELYERLVIIRFKAYENIGNDVAIVDSVEVAEQEVVKDSEHVELEEDLMMFDFSADDSHLSEKKNSTDDSKFQEPKNGINSEADNLADRSLNDNFKGDQKSVSDKYKKAPIQDLKEHIGINRKFLYVSDLFKGDGNAYNAAIGELNSCGSLQEAIDKVETIKADQGWQEENSTVVGFIELIERRYIK